MAFDDADLEVIIESRWTPITTLHGGDIQVGRVRIVEGNGIS
jgi:hypothetical protein